MSYNDPNNLGAIVQRDYTVDIGKFISRGWELFQRNIGGFISFFLITFLITGLLPQIPYLGILFLLINLIITGPLVAGYYFVAFKLLRGGSSEFEDFFTGFKNNNFLPLFLSNLVVGLITILVALPGILCLMIGVFSFISNSESARASASVPFNIPLAIGTPLFLIGLLLYLIPIIYLGIAYAFVLPLVVDKRVGFWEAMEASRQLITRKWFSFFLFSLVLGVINLLGVLACCVGIIFTVPLTVCALAVSYEEIVGLRPSSADAL